MPKRFIFTILILIIALYPENETKDIVQTETPLFYDYKGHRWIYEDKRDSFKLNPQTGLYIPIDSIEDTVKKVSFKDFKKDTVVKILTEDDIIQLIENEKY